jgi:hypothetical protein
MQSKRMLGLVASCAVTLAIGWHVVQAPSRLRGREWDDGAGAVSASATSAPATSADRDRTHTASGPWALVAAPPGLARSAESDGSADTGEMSADDVEAALEDISAEGLTYWELPGDERLRYDALIQRKLAFLAYPDVAERLMPYREVATLNGRVLESGQ